MVDLATLQAVSYIMGSLGVFLAAVYYILNIQNNRRNQELMLKAQQQTLETRQAQMFMSLYEKISSPEIRKSFVSILLLKYAGWDSFYKEYVETSSDFWAQFIAAASFFNGIGILMKKGLIDIELTEELISNTLFSVGRGMAPIMDDYRKHYYARFADVVAKKHPVWSGFYYLYDELKKRDAATGY